MDYKNEIQPVKSQITFYGTAIFSAFDCIVYEDEGETGFIYTAQNYKTKETYTLTKRKNPITEKDLPHLAEKIHHSPIAGYNRYLIDRPYGERLLLDKAQEILKQYHNTNSDIIFISIINEKPIILESQTGIEDCLLPAVIIKRGRINDSKLSSKYGDMPIVIGTPNKDKIQKQINNLSLTLINNDNILTPLETDFYICSHYGLFSAKLPDYQLLIIDEAHKFPQAVRKVLAESIDLSKIASVRFRGNETIQTTKKLISESRRYIKDNEERHLENLSDISARLLLQIGDINDFTNELKRFQNLTDNRNLVWIEENEIKCSPKNSGERLQELFWNTEKPIILTSNLLSLNSDYSLFTKSLGLKDFNDIQNVADKKRVIEFYDSLPFPNTTNAEYVEKLSEKIEQLLTDDIVFLFTSFNLMKVVTEILNRDDLPFYMFDREDTPQVSTVVITKLPFLTPDPISRYEQAQYENYEAYRREVLIPDMLIKLRRATLNADKVIILDSRKEYREAIRRAFTESLTTFVITA
jgi:Rad3-related DNA helicase